MDQNQWNALNQLLSKQSPKTTSISNVKASGRQSQPTRVISAAESLSQQRNTQQLNGAQQSVMETGGSGVVKSLLTGRQYAQSVLRPDVAARGQTKPAAAKNPGGKQQVSVLQPNWQQSQQTVDATTAGAETQQLVLTGLPENIGPGESLYVVVDGVTYQIDSSNAELLAAATGNSTAASGASVVPIGSRMSLEDLANISAEQQNLSLDYQAASGEMAATSVEIQAANTSASEATTSAAQQLDGQQFLETQATGTTATNVSGNSSEPMQIIILPAEGGDVKSADFKVGGQDFILQPGQQLPRDLQEMVARGLPIDFSNYEFVIQEEDGSAAQDGSGTTYLSSGQVLGGGGDATSVMVSLAGSAVGGASGDDILGMLADASNQQSHGIKLDFQQWAGAAAASSIPVIEEDDGEFAYVTGNPDDGSGEPAAHIVQRVVTESGFLSSFTDFLSGAKSETLSSVANSTVIRRTPQLPIAYVPESKRKMGSAQDNKSKSPMTIVVQEGSSQKVMYVSEGGTPVSGRGRGRGRGRPPGSAVTQRFARSVPAAGEAGATKEQIRQSIITRSTSLCLLMYVALCHICNCAASVNRLWECVFFTTVV